MKITSLQLQKLISEAVAEEMHGSRSLRSNKNRELRLLKSAIRESVRRQLQTEGVVDNLKTQAIEALKQLKKMGASAALSAALMAAEVGDEVMPRSRPDTGAEVSQMSEEGLYEDLDEDLD